MSEGGRQGGSSKGKGPGAPGIQADQPPVARSLKPSESLGSARFNPIREERQAAATQIARSLKAWRSASGSAAGRGAIPKSGSSPLPSSVRSRMEPKLGADLSGVNVHTGSESAQAARDFGARAFTVGSDVHFNAGEFSPGTKEGDRLIAHELTHVVQGQRSGVQRKEEEGGGGDDAAGGAEVSDPGEPAEKEADATADQVSDELHGGDEKKGGGDEKKGAEEGGAEEQPAPISAKLEGVGRKAWRAAAPPAAAGGAPPDPMQSEQCKQFKARFTALLASLKMPADDAAADAIFKQVTDALQATDAAYKAAPNAPNSPRKDLSNDAFTKIMKDFEPITAALQPYMEKFTKGKKIWGFWSGKPACEVAKNNSEVSLEKSALGSLFDGININGSWDIQMWASLSKAYATNAAAAVGHAEYRGFVGAGSSAEQSIFNKVEQPQFISMLSEKQQAELNIKWFACAQDPKDPGKPDATCSAGGMAGVMGTGDRGSMVAMAESMNEKRIKLFKDTGKVVAPDKVDAAIAAAAKGGAAAPGASAPPPASKGAAAPPASKPPKKK